MQFWCVWGREEAGFFLPLQSMHIYDWKKWFQNLIILQNGLRRVWSRSQKAHKPHRHNLPVRELSSYKRRFTHTCIDITQKSSKTVASQIITTYTHFLPLVIFPVECGVSMKIALNPKQVIYRVIQRIDAQTFRHIQTLSRHGFILFADLKILRMMRMKYKHLQYTHTLSVDCSS